MRSGGIQQTNAKNFGVPRYGTLQAARAIAALMVVCFHAAALVQSPQYWGVTLFGGWADIGASGVAFFFVLSGFLIYRLHHDDIGRPERLRLYANRRFKRIFPLYWLVTLAALAFYGSDAGYEAVASLLLIGPASPPLAVAWTLYHELLFYALFAALIAHRRIGIVIMCVWLAISVLAVTPGYALASINILFGFGIFAAWALPKIEIMHPRTVMILGITIFLAAGVASLALWGEHHPVRQPLWVMVMQGIGGALTIVGAVKAEAKGLLEAPATLVVAGNASYAIYLVHYPIIGATAKLLPDLYPGLAFAILFAAGVSGGLVVHLLFERAARRIPPAKRLRLATA